MGTTGLTAYAVSLPKLSDNSENYPLFLHKNTLDNVYYQVKNGKNGGSDENTGLQNGYNLYILHKFTSACS